MDDRTLLERAAKAAGYDAKWRNHFYEPFRGFEVNGSSWNPLTDDGDEARLEGAMCFNVSWDMASVTVDSATERYSDHGGDKQKARRRAGVRAAAEIGGE